METDKNWVMVIAVVLLLFALNQQTKIATQKLSIMDTLIPSATGIEKMILWWLGIGIIILILLGSFYWKK